MFYVEVIAIWY